MAKTPQRKAEEEAPRKGEPTPLERMTELTRRILRVPKEEVVKPTPKRRPRHV